MAAKSPRGVEKLHSSLEDLVWNSKSLITRLIWLEDDINDIQIKEAIGINREITSITKTFYCTYEKANRKTRKKLYDLRSTWEGIFSRTGINIYDVPVRNLDPVRSAMFPVSTQERTRNTFEPTRPTKGPINAQ